MHVIMIWRKPKSVERGRLDITLKITLHLEKVRVLEEGDSTETLHSSKFDLTYQVTQHDVLEEDHSTIIVLWLLIQIIVLGRMKYEDNKDSLPCPGNTHIWNLDRSAQISRRSFIPRCVQQTVTEVQFHELLTHGISDICFSWFVSNTHCYVPLNFIPKLILAKKKKHCFSVKKLESNSQ